MQALIIEDDPMVREINKRYLEKDGRVQSIIPFANGRDALAYLKEHDVPLVILDVYMPKMNGLEFLTELRKLERLTDVIIVTAANDYASMEKALRLGALDYLVKPFEYARFKQALDKFFNKQKMLQIMPVNLSQKDADELFSSSESSINQQSVKGIQQRTLDVIQSYLDQNRNQKFSGSELAKLVGLSRVTVHKYLNYLESQQKLNSEIDYETEGRPRLLYYIPQTRGNS